MMAVATRPRARRTIIAAIERQRERLGRKMAVALDDFFAGQATRAARRMFGDYKMLPGPDALIPASEDAVLSAAIRQYIDQGLLSGVELATLTLGANPVPTFSPLVQQLLGQSGTRIVRINTATRNAVRETLQEANMRGYSAYQTANGVRADGFRGLRSVVRETYKDRAQTIARTEQAWASQTASHAQWQELGVQFVDLTDGDEDEECAARNGTRVPVTVDTGPLHPNCTVMSVPVV